LVATTSDDALLPLIVGRFDEEDSNLPGLLLFKEDDTCCNADDECEDDLCAYLSAVTSDEDLPPPPVGCPKASSDDAPLPLALRRLDRVDFLLFGVLLFEDSCAYLLAPTASDAALLPLAVGRSDEDEFVLSVTLLFAADGGVDGPGAYLPAGSASEEGILPFAVERSDEGGLAPPLLPLFGAGDSSLAGLGAYLLAATASDAALLPLAKCFDREYFNPLGLLLFDDDDGG